ncbi:hypothetical protein INR49_023952 [Caranx melampygus]|nr:hypothetical protein INR49_023952 [Caranx melampygus]
MLNWLKETVEIYVTIMVKDLVVAPRCSRAVTLIIILILLLFFLRAEKNPEPKDVVISPASLSLYSARHKLQDELILYYLFMDTVTQADATSRQTRWLKGAGQAWMDADLAGSYK